MTEKSKEININNSKISILEIVDTPPEKQIKEQKNEHDNDKKVECDEIIESPKIDYDEEEDVEEIRKRIMIILRYKNSKRFQPYLKKQGFDLSAKELKGKSIEELDALINDIRFCISTKNTNDLYETAATTGIVVLENLLRPVYKIDGLSQVLTKDPMYLDLVEEIMLERANFMYVKPEYRLLYCVLSSAYIIHNQHQMLEKLSQTTEGKQIIKEFASQMKEKESEKTVEKIIISGPQVEKKEISDSFVEKYNDLLS